MKEREPFGGDDVGFQEKRINKEGKMGGVC